MNNNSIKENSIFAYVVAIILFIALSFICYNKFINNRNNIDNENKLIMVRNGELKEIKLTTKNQKVQLGNKLFDIRIEKDEEDEDTAGNLYINDISIKNMDDPEINLEAIYAYATNDFMFFTSYGQIPYYVVYAINSNGDELLINDNDYSLDDFRIENDLITATGIDMMEALDDDEPTIQTFVIKHENNVVTIESRG